MATSSQPDVIRVAVIGAGRQGRDLINYGLSMPGVRFEAVCDIWPYARTYATNLLRKRGHDVTAYEDYRLMLNRELILDAVIIATPDSFHAEQTIACLERGLHVYCEKEMATTIEGARQMVQAARRNRTADHKRLHLQIGRQHRSNPRYHLALEYLCHDKAIGRITNVFGQWHGHKRVPYTWPEAAAIDSDTLKRYGFNSMDEHRNWRWFEKFSAGELANLGSHQIDVFTWFIGSPPKAVSATGGLDYYKQFELYDNAQCLLDWNFAWEGKTHTVRGTYNIQTATDDGGFFEVLFGDEGSMGLSEDMTKGGIYREEPQPKPVWERDLQPVAVGDTAYVPYGPSSAWELFAYGTRPPTLPLGMMRVYIPMRLYAFPGAGRDYKPPHWHHLKNFFDTIAGETTSLNCSGEVGLQTCITVLKAAQAMKTSERLELKPADFEVRP